MYKLATKKIVKISGTHYVSLPKSWLDNKNVSAGDNLELNMDEEGRLIVFKEDGNGKTQPTK